MTRLGVSSGLSACLLSDDESMTNEVCETNAKDFESKSVDVGHTVYRVIK